MDKERKEISPLIAEERTALRAEFDAAPRDSFFPESVISVVTGLSAGKLALDRMVRTGINFYKVGAAVRYKKGDVLDYMESVRVAVSGVGPATANDTTPGVEVAPRMSKGLADLRERLRANPMRGKK